MWTNDSVEIAQPVDAAYRHWSQDRPFPRLVDGFDALDPEDDRGWLRALEVDRIERNVDTVIVEESPGRRIVWISVHGPERVGIVTFDSLAAGRSRVTLHLNFDTGGTVGEPRRGPAFIKATISGCLQRFARRAEAHGQASGTTPE